MIRRNLNKVLAITLTVIFVCVLFVSCDTHEHEFSQIWKTNETNHWQECSCGEKTNEAEHTASKWIIDKAATTAESGSKHKECSVCKKVLETANIAQLTGETRTVDFYAINDFHGSVDKISQMGGFLKSNANQNSNTVILNSGDMFQGSMESNSNYGKLLADCMTKIGFDALTFGNHEFDWGLDNLKKLANGCPVPFLGANIYHWNAKDNTWGDFANEIAKEYVVKELDNGLKVGIIGVIGDNQITSISSNLVQTIGFKEPTPIIQSLSNKLRADENCDIVVVSIHSSASSLNGSEIDGYVDAVFSAHTHQTEFGFYDSGIPYIQGGSYGQNVSHIQLSVDSNGDVSCLQNRNVAYNNSWPNLYVVDELVDNSNDKIKDEANQVLATVNGSLAKNPTIPRMVARAIADYAVSQGYDIALAMVNTARNGIYKTNITYTELYEAIPFDNVVYIAKVKGIDILRQSSLNAIWRVDGKAIKNDEWYTIAIIDYLLFHQNAQRVYNYFPTAFESGVDVIPLTKGGYDMYNYRFITRDWLLKCKHVNVEDFADSVLNVATSRLGESVDLSK